MGAAQLRAWCCGMPDQDVVDHSFPVMRGGSCQGILESTGCAASTRLKN